MKLQLIGKIFIHHLINNNNEIITFNFDPETETVSDVKCSIDGVEKKKKTTKTKKM